MANASPLKKLTELKKKLASSTELRNIGQEATYRVTLPIFTDHPEVVGLLWMYKVPIHHWEDDVVRIGDGYDDVTPTVMEQDITLPRVLVPIELAHGMALHGHYFAMPDDGRVVAVIRLDVLKHKLPAIAIHVFEIFMKLVELKPSLGPAWGESVRVVVYRVGPQLEVQITQQHGRDLDWHDDIGNNVKMERNEDG